MMTTFEDLEVWKRGCQLAVDIYVAFGRAPQTTLLKARFSAQPFPFPRTSPKALERDSEGDFIRFLRYSKGSCAELRTQLYMAKE